MEDTMMTYFFWLKVLSLFFTLTLTCLNIIILKKKHYLCLFIPCLLFLPNYYGIALSDKLPILTATRIMFIVLFIYTILNKKRSFKDLMEFAKALPKYTILLYGYFIFRISSNLFHITTYTSALKTILLILIEQFSLFIVIGLLAPDKDERFLIIKSVVWSAVGIFTIGISESLTSSKIITQSLYTVHRLMWNDSYYRLGVLRSTSTLGLANYFGNACILVLPLIIYLYSRLNQKRYLLAIIITILAIIHSGCRSDLFFLIALTVMYFLHLFKSRERINHYIKAAVFIASSTAAIILIFSLSSPTMANYYKGMGGLLSNEFKNEDLTYGISTYDVSNGTGSSSRLMQFSGLYYVATKSPVIGLGSGAEIRGDVKYYVNESWGSEKGWNTIYSYDVGIVEIFCNEGILGLIGVVMLLAFLFNDSKKSGIFTYRLLLPTYLMCTLSTSNMLTYIFVYIIIFSPAIYKEEQLNSSFVQ